MIGEPTMFSVPLNTLSQQAMKLHNRATRDFVGKDFLMPAKEIIGNYTEDYTSKCTVETIDLVEGAMEISYEHEGDYGLWAVISIDAFEKYAREVK